MKHSKGKLHAFALLDPNIAHIKFNFSCVSCCIISVTCPKKYLGIYVWTFFLTNFYTYKFHN